MFKPHNELTDMCECIDCMFKREKIDANRFDFNIVEKFVMEYTKKIA